VKHLLLAVSLFLSTGFTVKPAVDHNDTLPVNPKRLIKVLGPINENILPLANKLEHMSKSKGDIYILVNSPGGSAAAGGLFVDAMHMVKKRGKKIHCLSTVMAASMAFSILLTCDTVSVLKNTRLLYHPHRIRSSRGSVLTANHTLRLYKSLQRLDKELIKTIFSKIKKNETTVKAFYEERFWKALDLKKYTKGSWFRIVKNIEGVSPLYQTGPKRRTINKRTTKPTIVNSLKYELTDDTIKHWGKTLYRIKALEDFSDIKKGDLGGYIEKESNLSQKGDCWVYHDAQVYGDAMVFENARVYGTAKVFGKAQVYQEAKVYGKDKVFDNARVFENARVYGTTWVRGNTKVYGNAKVFGDTIVSGNALVFGNAKVYGDALVAGNARVYGTAKVFGKARVYHDAQVYGDAIVAGNALVFDNARVFENARAYGTTWVRGNTKVYGNAKVFGDAHVFGSTAVFGNARVLGSARVFGIARLSGNAQVSGDARVFNNNVTKKQKDVKMIEILKQQIEHYTKQKAETATKLHMLEGALQALTILLKEIEEKPKLEEVKETK
jgi:ATP-dependent protease ClpP protease subunit/carbonic anhydrase/acetyltransferase-like protein (isoleucine patch superfamily)